MGRCVVSIVLDNDDVRVRVMDVGNGRQVLVKNDITCNKERPGVLIL
jgi:hypothetical protein